MKKSLLSSNAMRLGFGVGIGICIGLVLCITIYILYRAFNGSNRKSSKRDVEIVIHKPQYDDKVLGHSASSVDSERQFDVDSQWRGQRSRCYDCEADMESRCGDACVYNATKQKLFSV
jgi:hypothetical protein